MFIRKYQVQVSDGSSRDVVPSSVLDHESLEIWRTAVGQEGLLECGGRGGLRRAGGDWRKWPDQHLKHKLALGKAAL